MSSQTRGVFAERVATAAGFDADHLHRGILEKFVEEADSVGAAADAGVKMRGQALFRSEDLFAGFPADDGLKIADHRGVRMRAKDGAEQIVRVANVGDPIAHSFVDGVFEGLAARFHADDFGAEHTHASHVEGLAGHVFRAHVHGALEAKVRGNGGGRDAMLARAGFRDDSRLAHFNGEEPLADSVIDFVRAGVQEIFALQVDAETPRICRSGVKRIAGAWGVRRNFSTVPGIRPGRLGSVFACS